MNLSDVSIKRPVFAAMLTTGLVVLGLISLSRLEMQMDPDIEFPFLHVVTDLRGASPGTVEREVTDILEEHINSIEGIRTLSSISSQGRSRISVEFELGYEVDTKAQEVRDKVALARSFLPRDVEDSTVQKFDLNSIAVLTLVLGGPVTLRELSDLAEYEVKERLERLPGVGGVNVLGARERQIRIWLDPLRLAGYGLAVDDVGHTLRSENAELASGRIESDQREWSVTTQGKASSVEEFGAIVVAERAGRVVHLRDVAIVEDGMAEARSVARFNGQPGVAFEIQPQSGADLVSMAKHVRAEVATIRASLPPGVAIEFARDHAVYIEALVSSVFVDMLLATALVVAVVLIFLREGRSTLIAALAIPASVIASFTLFYALDLSLNAMTLIALSLAIGLVIDDAIVVLESIYRKLEAGEEPRAAAHRGAREVGLAVVSTTLAVCAVFVPIAFMQSIVGRYFYEFGVAVTVAVCMSTLVALTLTPMLASRWLRVQKEPGPVSRFFERGLHVAERGYQSLLALALRQRALTVGVGLAAVVGGCGVASTLPFNLYSNDDLNEVRVNAKLPVGTPLAPTDRLARQMEAVVAAHPDVLGVFSVTGNEILHEPNRIRLDVILYPKAERDHPIQRTFAELRERLAEALPEIQEFSVGFPAYADSGDHADLAYSLQGPDLARLERYAGQLIARMRDDSDLVDVRSSFETGRPQITLTIDRGRAADLGVTAMGMGRTIRTLLAGEKVGSFEDLGRRHDVRVQVLPEYRDDPNKLNLIRVRSASGALVPLTNAVHARIEEGPVEIRRKNRTREIRLSANMAAGVPLGEGAKKLEQWGRELGIAAPDALVAGGSARTMQETAKDIGFAFVLALAALYMVLASLFNSFTHPFTIMVSAPLSFIGGFVALSLAGMSLDMMSGIGLLVLMGLVMKNGILLVDYINQLRATGLERNAAILEAGPVRMRPVLMTSGALIFGMLPTVLFHGVGSEFRAPMAMITIGGLLTSTLLTLVVVPVVYSLVDDATLWLTRLLAPAKTRLSRVRTTTTTSLSEGGGI
ncbi:MAG: efflux RND transporter permease subunit [Deltaproteobacteria bacterium]|nr:efflux RND transporter permease subunit [Deltaproteobacteria bacterium]MBW2384096.1 efflux RND transporter permease subunit [Deltaproteobacteria bacterium]MBW2695375.1 efflux RND transporter permease subunit [Deltaproteobacteria bacterium]